jgi:cell division protein FtsQ
VAGLRSTTARALRLLPWAATFVLALALAPALGRLIRAHPYFAVRDIAVHQPGRLAPDAIRAAVGIEPGTSIWDVDVDAAAVRLRSLPWVRSARVRRELPQRVVVTVREYRPAAIVALADPDGALYYVAADGHIFTRVAADDGHDLPYLTGLTAKDLTGDDALGPRAIRRALKLLRATERTNDGLGEPSEVHIDRRHGLTLLAVRPKVPLELGWGGFETKLARFGRVLALWKGREAELAGLRCLDDDEVIVRTRAVAPAVPAGREPRRPART